MKTRQPRKLRDRRSGKSPYQSKRKKPFRYQHKDCSHRHSEPQSIPGWRGQVCAICNIITSNQAGRENNYARTS